MKKYLKGLIFIFFSVLLLLFIIYKLHDIFSKSYYLTADEFNSRDANWQYIEAQGGLAYNGAILVSQVKGASLRRDFFLLSGKYDLWMRFYTGPQYGSCKIRVDGREFSVNQNGKRSIVFRKLGTVYLEKNRHTVFLENTSLPDDFANLDFLFFTNNLFFYPRLTLLGYSPIKKRNPAYYILNFSDIFIAFFLYWLLFLIFCRSKTTFHIFNAFRENLRKDACRRFTFASVLFLTFTFISEINGHFILADFFANLAYICFVIAVVIKSVIFKRRMNI